MSEVREELGTCKSAVESFANLMAVAIDVPEVQLHYWLDCYYQLRRAYEAERMGDAPEAERAVPAEEKAEEPKKQAVPKAPKPAKSEATGFSGKKASMKQEAYNKLCAARASGITFSELSLATNHLLSEGDVMSMVNAQPMTDRKWEIMAVALQDLEKQGRLNGGGS